jgi:DnaJ family protein C protein 7
MLAQVGNAAFQRGAYTEAMDAYTAALDLSLPEQQGLRAVLHSNRAAALHAMGRHVDAIADCYAAQAYDASYLRLYQRRAENFAAISDHNSALQVGQVVTAWCC